MVYVGQEFTKGAMIKERIWSIKLWLNKGYNGYTDVVLIYAKSAESRVQ